MIVVNKADHPLADTMVREIKGVLALGPREAGRYRSCAPKLSVAREWRSSPMPSPITTRSSRPRAPCRPVGGVISQNEVLAIATYRLRRQLEESIANDPSVGPARAGRRPRARPGERGDRDLAHTRASVRIDRRAFLASAAAARAASRRRPHVEVRQPARRERSLMPARPRRGTARARRPPIPIAADGPHTAHPRAGDPRQGAPPGRPWLRDGVARP